MFICVCRRRIEDYEGWLFDDLTDELLEELTKEWEHPTNYPLVPGQSSAEDAFDLLWESTRCCLFCPFCDRLHVQNPVNGTYECFRLSTETSKCDHTKCFEALPDVQTVPAFANSSGSYFESWLVMDDWQAQVAEVLVPALVDQPGLSKPDVLKAIFDLTTSRAQKLVECKNCRCVLVATKDETGQYSTYQYEKTL
jgi:hypothetical protein